MICHYCKKSFKGWKAKQKFCSQFCYWKAKIGSRRNTVLLKCLECGKKMIKNKYHLMRGEGKYCSNKCVGIINGKQRSGSNHWNWKGGISPRVLSTVKYKEWRRKVFERDKYICVECGYDKGRIIQADHIKSWRGFPQLRFKVSNGRTLCKPCHKKTPTWGYHRKVT